MAYRIAGKGEEAGLPRWRSSSVGDKRRRRWKGKWRWGHPPPLHIYTHTDEMQTKEAEGP